MRVEFYPGDRVLDRTDGREGTVVFADWGGVYVDVDETRTEGRERRLVANALLDKQGER